MENFLNEAAVRESARRARRRAWVFRGLAGAVPAALIVLCLLTRTGNARAMLAAAWAVVIGLGWAAIAWWMFALEPARAEERHRKGLVSVEPELREGLFFLTPDSFRIPKSVRVRKIRLETGEGALSLNLAESLVPRAPADGSRVRVRTARKFITGLETLIPGPDAPRKEPDRLKAAGRMLGRFLPAALLWAMTAVMLTGFVFTRITDTDPAHKITVYALCEVKNGAELAERLERALGGAVRMVKVHPFTYAMFGSEALRTADLYIVPDSERDAYRDWFAPAPESGPIL